LGAPYVALAAFALITDSPTAHRAVGFAWLGAAVGRIVGLVRDRPETDHVFWGS